MNMDDSTREKIKIDYARYSRKSANLLNILYKVFSSPGFRAVFLYRLSSELYKEKRYHLAGFFERVGFHTCYCQISSTAEIGPGLLIAHTFGLVIGGGTTIGSQCDVRQNVTFGGNFSKKDAEGRSKPIVGDNVSFGAGAAILGPITIGDDAIIGANSVVTRDIPPGVIVSGVPAKVIKERWDQGSGRRL